MTVRSPALPAALAFALLALVACGGDSDPEPQAGAQNEGTAVADGPGHAHGLGVNPADGEVYVATHTGVFRSPAGSGSLERVGDGLQDTMGFAVVGPDRFLASGHPGPGESGSPNLGLIVSTDAGETWEEVSLGGEADFHVLRHAHGRIYGFDATGARLMLSDDEGASWTERPPPALVVDLAIDPDDPERIVASTDRGLARSEDDGRRWLPVGRGHQVGLLAWPSAARLHLIDPGGEVRVSADAGETWERVGELGAPPAGLVAGDELELHAALADGTVLRSLDGGSSWSVHAAP